MSNSFDYLQWAWSVVSAPIAILFHKIYKFNGRVAVIETDNKHMKEYVDTMWDMITTVQAELKEFNANLSTINGIIKEHLRTKS